MNWLDAAQALPEGRTRKIQHGCGDTLALQINHGERGWSAHCHRCGENLWEPKPAESLTEKLARLRRIKEAERAVEASLSLPGPEVHDVTAWPLTARVWVYKAGLANSDIEHLGIYWNPRISRVVIPIRDETGKLIYWQARTLDKGNPKKYLNPRVAKQRLLAKHGTGPLVVLTEDILSAYRVSGVGVAGWCLLGTKINSHTVTQLMRTALPVAVWLDPDKPGQDAALQIIKTLRARGLTVRNIVSEKDPKLMSRDQIAAILEVGR